MKKYFYSLLLFCFLFGISHSFAQQRKIDSLQLLLRSAKEDTVKINLLNDLCWEYKFSNPYTALLLAKQALSLSQKALYSKGIIQAYSRTGVIYSSMSEYKKAFENMFNSLKIAELCNNKDGMVSAYNNIGILYKGQKQYDKALIYYFNALKINIEGKDNTRISANYDNIGNIYFLSGLYHKALNYYIMALSIEEINNKYGMGNSLNNMGNCYLKLGDDFKAEECYQKSLKIKREIDDKRGITSTLINIADIYKKNRKYKEATKYYNDGLPIARQISAKSMIKMLYGRIATMDSLFGDFKNAFIYYQLYYAMNDSIYNENSQKVIAEMQTKYETEKKQREIEIQKLKIDNINVVKRNLWLLLSVCMLLLLLTLLFFNRYRIKQREKLSILQIAQQETLFKTIIKIQEDERNRFSKDIHDGMGQYLSALKMNISSLMPKYNHHTNEMESSVNDINELVDELYKEIRNISFNIMPAVLVNNGLFSALEELTGKIKKTSGCDIKLDTFYCINRFDSLFEINIYRIIQELLNNIIKYAKSTNINVQITQHENELNIIIEDNGIGFDTALLDKNTGNGWRNIKSRLQLHKGTIHIDSEPGRRGTTAIIDISLIN